MNLKSLQYFEKLIELKSYSSVYDYFNVYQSTISMGIKRLEEDTGCQLVIHNLKHNEIVLTQAGKILHKYSKVIVDQVPKFNHEIKKYQQQLNLELGMPPMLNNSYFPKLATNLSSDILANLDIVDKHSKELIKMLKKGEIFVAVVASTKPIKLRELKSKILTKDKFKLIVSEMNPLAKQNNIKLKDLNQEKIIEMVPGFIQADVIDEIKAKHPGALNVIYRAKDPELMKELVKSNVGISMLLSKEIYEQDDLVEIDLDCESIPEIYISLVWRSTYEKNERAHRLINTIVDSIHD